VRPPKIKWQPGEASAAADVPRVAQGLTLFLHICLNRPSFPTLPLTLRHDLLTERHPSGPTYVLPNFLVQEISKDLYFFDNHSFTD
jgi:hypothetical protein